MVAISDIGAGLRKSSQELNHIKFKNRTVVIIYLFISVFFKD
jgi:hypothetical protein